MSVSKDQIRDLLGTGLSVTDVASAVGCDHSYISQLMADEAFADEVRSLKTRALTASTARDKRIDEIEDGLIDILSEQVSQRMIYKPNDVVRTFAVLNAAKRRGLPNKEQAIITNNIVQLNVPVQVINSYRLNKQNEVVDIEGQTLVAMPAQQLLSKLAADNKGVTGDAYKRVASFLPGQEGLTYGTSESSGN